MSRYLVVNPFGLGDVLFSLHVVDALQQADPQAEVDFLANERTRSLLALCPQVRQIYEFNRDELRNLRRLNMFRYLKRYWDLAADLRRAKYDAMLDFSLGREFALLGAAAGIPKRAGLNYKNRGFFLTSKIPFGGYEDSPVYVTQLEVIPALGLPKPIATKPRIRIPRSTTLETHSWLSKNISRGREQLLALAPGGGRSWGEQASFKQWPTERFSECANRFLDGSSGTVLLFGDASERQLLEQCASALKGPYHMLCGEPIDRVASLLKECRALLCNDGGLMHLAAALEVPLTAFFGPVDERVYGPDSSPKSDVLTQAISCRPCYQQFKFTGCAHQRRCLDEITPDRAWSSLKKWLSPA